MRLDEVYLFDKTGEKSSQEWKLLLLKLQQHFEDEDWEVSYDGRRFGVLTLRQTLNTHNMAETVVVIKHHTNSSMLVKVDHEEASIYLGLVDVDSALMLIIRAIELRTT